MTTCAAESCVNTIEINRTPESVNKTPNIRCFISCSKCLNEGDSNRRYDDQCTRCCCLQVLLRGVVGLVPIRASLSRTSIHVQRIAIWFIFVLVFFCPFHRLLEFLFQDPIAILHRIHFLSEDLFAHLFLLVQSLYHLVKGGQRLVFH